MSNTDTTSIPGKTGDINGNIIPQEKKGKDPVTGRFTKGHTYGLSGRPLGSRHKATLEMEQALSAVKDGVVNKVMQLALEGDIGALKLVMERLYPAPKDRPVRVDMEQMKGLEDATNAMATVTKHVTDGEITPSEGSSVAGIIDVFRRTIEAQTIETRLAELENILKEKKLI